MYQLTSTPPSPLRHRNKRRRRSLANIFSETTYIANVLRYTTQTTNDVSEIQPIVPGRVYFKLCYLQGTIVRSCRAWFGQEIKLGQEGNVQTSHLLEILRDNDVCSPQRPPLIKVYQERKKTTGSILNFQIMPVNATNKNFRRQMSRFCTLHGCVDLYTHLNPLLIPQPLRRKVHVERSRRKSHPSAEA